MTNKQSKTISLGENGFAKYCRNRDCDYLSIAGIHHRHETIVASTSGGKIVKVTMDDSQKGKTLIV